MSATDHTVAHIVINTDEVPVYKFFLEMINPASNPSFICFILFCFHLFCAHYIIIMTSCGLEPR